MHTSMTVLLSMPPVTRRAQLPWNQSYAKGNDEFVYHLSHFPGQGALL